MKTFSVSASSTVNFSKGNLQYNAAQDTWRFAENQWDTIGAANANISETYDGWIDLFGWGTSGWNSGANAYQPWATSTTDRDYYPGGSYENNLTGDYANADWGVYNAISNGGNQAGMWRTLTKDEWEYLLNTRTASTVGGTENARYAKANVGGVSGVIILPDSFTKPARVEIVNINTSFATFNGNSYTTEQWAALEAAGAIFLPVAGYRVGTGVGSVGTLGGYCSGTYYNENGVWTVGFDRFSLDVNGHVRTYGWSVRLVKATEQAGTSEAFDTDGASLKTFSVSASSTVNFSKGNLQYNAAQDTWRFAENQYDYVGNDNSNISSSYNGWIDLFGWGTSGWNSGANAYQPWSTSITSEDYSTNNLTGAYANADWGVYNAISNGGNQAGMWRSMTKDEWEYLLNTRNASTVGGTENARYAKATVGGVLGAIIFPDSFTLPAEVGEPVNINTASAAFDGNTYTTEQWTELETAGAIFLPAAGDRGGTEVSREGTQGGYWSSTHDDGPNAWFMFFLDGYFSVESGGHTNGFSVRLVKGSEQAGTSEAFDTNGASVKTFSVSASSTVNFSKGNLQYNAAQDTWRFAENQYDYVGNDNSNASSSYNGWIDIFGWGTSGWNSGANAYQPWATSETDEDYYVGGSGTNSLTGAYANADWGVYNAISNGGNQAGMWRTMTKDEWDYLLNTRTASTVSGIANARYAKATVGGVAGVIILPDDFTMPAGVTDLVNVNTTAADYSDNTYSTEDWAKLEAAGTIFLPAAGGRSGTEVYYVGSEGNYWSSTYYDEDYAWFMFSNDDYLRMRNDHRYYGLSVRLVMGSEQEAPAGAFDADGASLKTFSVSASSTVNFSKGNLQYNAAQDTWRFAENQYDYVGNDNSNASSSYNGWIDLFGWGTSGWNSGANEYQPWATSATNSDYYPGGSYTNNLTGAYANADWGVYNAISNGGNAAGMWRTMTSDEWVYLLNTRTASTVGGIENARYAKATVGGVAGLIILPDSFTLPTEVGNVVNINNEDVDYTGNIYSTEQWTAMETAGAVFLPAAGNCYGTELVNVGILGSYWSSTYDNESNAWSMNFSDDNFSVGRNYRYFGQSVRLVKATEQEAPTGAFDADGASLKTFSVSASSTVNFSKGNLQYNAAQDTWRFAENQYDYVGEDNSNASSSYNGWIDLFGWGTSGWNSGANAYQPWATSTTNSDYSGGSYTNSLTGEYANADWGVYNAISNGGNAAGMWRTMTKDEWDYLLNTRTASTVCGVANARYAKVTVGGVAGLIIFPDSFTMPAGINDMVCINASDAEFECNPYYTTEQWTAMETAGAVFLPAAGSRHGTELTYPGADGIYWSSTYLNEDRAWIMHFYEVDLGVDGDYRLEGHSVRLVKATEQAGTSEAFDADGASVKTFSVSASSTVNFSKGNLQYNAAQDTWRFAENQYDYVGNDNSNASSSYNGWIDLFGWGTSGWNSGANEYQPWATSTTYADYYPGGSYTNSLTGAYSNADWGVYNAISNGGNQAGMWRSLTKDEWDYLLNTRTASTVGGTANARYAKATVGGFSGLIILPDDFTLPAGVSDLVNVNTTDADYSDYSDNTYSTEQWTAMETAGAIFLPAAGDRSGTVVSELGTRGRYWSSSYSSESSAWSMYFGGDYLRVGSLNRSYGWSVRLVKPTEQAGTSEAFDADGASVKTFSVSASSTVNFSKGNLQYNAAQDTWRFAENQWDTIGAANANISETYDGWIDLFGWGTSGWSSGANAYQPWATSEEYSDYYPGGSYTNNLTGDYANADWGVYNAISNGGNAAGMWRTMKSDEWEYLLNTRSASTVNGVDSARYAKATVGGVIGLIILPDSFTMPAGVELGNINTKNAAFAGNTYTTEQWTALETAGAIFLPTTGYRSGTSVDDVGYNANYWSSTSSGEYVALYMVFFSNSVYVNTGNYSYGFAVRLVKDSDVGGGNTEPQETGEWIDMGLPSGTQWYSVNLGASAPEEYGSYFAWGETTTKENYTWDTYRYGTSANTLTKYCNDASSGLDGFTDTLTVLVDGDDAARDALGNTSHMPTEAEWQELIDNSTGVWTTQNGVNGWKFTSNANGNYLFLPAGGAKYGASTIEAGATGRYWSSSLYTDFTSSAVQFTFASDNASVELNDRMLGMPVRAVKSATPTTSEAFDENGASVKTFSVSASSTVNFSKGNLQYNAAQDTWRFAENQYDYVGNDNSNISPSYNGWIDLFGWGTSGWNSGANAYQPWATSTTDDDYSTNSLTGDYANADWGVYNAISNGGNQAGMWRSLTMDEWNYLLFTRSASTVGGTANARYAKATVGDVTGAIILPDDFTMPAGVTELVNINTATVTYTGNTYTIEQWTALETAGAIFLPAAGIRESTEVYNIGAAGGYWSSTRDATAVWDLRLMTSQFDLMGGGGRYGRSVRLVKD